ncbi:MAG: CRISPR-associated endonuclease Cas1 [Desulfurispora sp.]|uniref:CRISPR-associated endonuclease Cas1 n=1 Tax=Desulfurispora sp. TaxID=3014275 RepID=UPI0040490478
MNGTVYQELLSFLNQGKMLEQPGEVVVADYGSFVGKKSERLVVKKEGRVVLEVPFYNLRSLVIETSGASISTDCIVECAQRGISIGFLTADGKPCATLVSPYLTGTVITRRAQYEAYKDRRGMQLVKHFITGKLKNQVNTLRYFAKYRKAADGELYDGIQSLLARMEPLVEELAAIDGQCIEDVRGQIMSVED